MDWSAREDAEARLARQLARLGADVYMDVTQALGDPPDLARLTREVWMDIEQRYRGALASALEGVFLEALDALSEETGFALEWGQANAAAAQWARQRALSLAQDLNQTSQRLLSEAVADFFEQGWTIDQLRDKISAVFGPSRAETIAITEVTMAVAQGEAALVAELEKAGVRMIAIWNTAEDERVCPVCAPRNGQRRGDAWQDLPPAHTRCRCWVSYEWSEGA